MRKLFFYTFAAMMAFSQSAYSDNYNSAAGNQYNIYTATKISLCNTMRYEYPQSAGTHINVGDIYQLLDGTVVTVTSVDKYVNSQGQPDTRISSYVDDSGNIIASGLFVNHYGQNLIDKTGPTIITNGTEYQRGTYLYPSSIKNDLASACIVTSDAAKSTKYTKISLPYDFSANVRPSPLVFGIKMDGSAADAELIQTYVDLYSPNVMTLSGLWRVAPANSWNAFDGMYHINHNQNKTGTFWNFTSGEGIQNSLDGGPLTGYVADTDLQENYYNGALHFSMMHNRGVFYGPIIEENYTNKSSDHPHYFSNGEYNNTIIHRINSKDDGNSGQSVLLDLDSQQSVSKGFSSQTQGLAFTNKSYGKDNYWSLVGGDTDYTWERPYSSFEMAGWEMDMTGSGSEQSDVCHDIPNTGHCSRFGIDIGANNTIDSGDQKIIPWQKNTNYTANYDFFWTKLQYDPISSSHITIRNGNFVDGQPKYAVFRAVPPYELKDKLYSSYTATSSSKQPDFLHHLDGNAFAEDARASNSVWWQYVGDNTFEFGLGITFDAHNNTYYGTGISAVNSYFKNAFVDIHKIKPVDKDFAAFRVPTDMPAIDFVSDNASSRNVNYLKYSTIDKSIEFISNNKSIFRIDTSGNVYVSQSLYLGVMRKTNILAINSPKEGEKVFDIDSHNEVTYRCPLKSTCGWYPTLYGAPLEKK